MGTGARGERIWVITVVAIMIAVGALGYVMVRGIFNSMDMINHGYYLVPSSEDSKFMDTYVYFVFTAPLKKGDNVRLISTHEYSYVVENWTASESQAGKKNVSFPTGFTGLVDGNFRLEVKRGNNIIYRGTVKFYADITFHASLEKINVNPVRPDRSYITCIHLNLTPSRAVYVSALNFSIGNYNAHIRVGRVIKNSTEINATLSYGKVVPLVKRGNTTLNLHILYPVLTDHGEVYSDFIKDYSYKATLKGNVNFIYPPIIITSMWTKDKGTILDFALNRTQNHRYHIVIYNSKGRAIGDSYTGWGYFKNGTIFMGVRFLDNYNFNDSYIAALEDEYNFTIDDYHFSLHAGPLRLVEHQENMKNESNHIALKSENLTLENLGNSVFHISYCEYNITYVFNGTTVTAGEYPWVRGTIMPGSEGNITLTIYANLSAGEEYRISMTFLGVNKEVKAEMSYVIEA